MSVDGAAMVSVVVPNWNGERLLPGCLDALAAQERRADQVIVVDNGSRDGSIALVQRRYPWVEVVALGRNTGFAGAANAGLAAAAHPLVAVLNSDARPRPGWLQALLGAPWPDDVWALGSVLVSPRTGLVESAGDAYGADGRAWKLGAGRAVGSLGRQPFEVFAPPGAAPVVRKQVVDRIGGWEERFFLYYEDIDLACRARAAGWRAMVVPTAVVDHDLGASGADARRFAARNSLWCAVRNLPVRWWPRLGLTTARELRWAHRDRALRPYVAGRLSALAGLAWAVRSRRQAGGGRAPLVAFLAATPKIPAVSDGPRVR